MKNLFLIFLLISFLQIQHINAQTSFLGFDQKQCGLIVNHGYTFENMSCANHGNGYKIFFNGKLRYQTCEQYLGKRVKDLFFINDSTGFLIEGNSNYGHGVYKTTDYGVTWKGLNTGAPVYLGYFLINEHNLYLITAQNSGGTIITRASDIKNNMAYRYNYYSGEKEVINKDTILGSSLCNYDTLSFKMKIGHDTISYIFVLKNEPITTVNQIKSAKQLELFPNPADDFINLVSARLGKAHIRIFNSSGITIKEFDDSNFNRLYIGDLKKGLYLIELNSGNNVQTGKFIKE